MSDTNNIYAEIKAPQLSDAKYGDNLDSQFNNINSNFTKIGSSAFTRGDKGDSVRAYNLIIKEGIPTTDDAVEGTLAYAIYKGLEDLGLFSIKGTQIPVQVIVDEGNIPYINDIKSNWEEFKNDESFWINSDTGIPSTLQGNWYNIIPFFYLDQKIYSENSILDSEHKDLTGVYTFKESAYVIGKGTQIQFTQNPISQSIYYDTNKETWCWSLGSNKTQIPIYKQIVDDKILIPWGDDKETYHAMYVYEGKDEGTRKNSLKISPYRKNKDDQWEAIKWDSTDEASTWPELNLDNYYLVHGYRFVASTGYFMVLYGKSLSFNSITANDLTVNGKLTNAGTNCRIVSSNIWGDAVRSDLIEVSAKGKLNINGQSNIRIVTGQGQYADGYYDKNSEKFIIDISNII